MRRALTVAALAGLALLVWRVWDHDAVLAWMRQASPVRYFTAMALLTVIGIPVTPLFVVAGATFGAAVGLIGSGLALAAALTMSYGIARGRMRRWLESLLRRFGSELPDFGEAGRNALRFTLMVKLTPGLPAFVKNYGLAAAGVPFPTFLGVSMLVTGAYAAATRAGPRSCSKSESPRRTRAAAYAPVTSIETPRKVGKGTPAAARP